MYFVIKKNKVLHKLENDLAFALFMAIYGEAFTKEKNCYILLVPEESDYDDETNDEDYEDDDEEFY